MKAQIYILALYVLYLAVVPCKDAFCIDAMNSSNCTLSAQTADRGCHHDVDLCSPFCTCNCCASAVSKIKVIHLNSVVLPIVRLLVASYRAEIVSASPAPIWQPPKK